MCGCARERVITAIVSNTNHMMWLWGLVAAAALLWPDRINSPLDGVPLDRTAEAILIGLVFPALWVFHPRFLATRFARASIIALVAWKAFGTSTLVQDGWCVRFQPERPFAKDAMTAPHAWDLRADWRTLDPACSAIMTRSYHDVWEFPVWFFNLPPPNDNWPVPEDYPPKARVGMRVAGFLSATTGGLLDIEVGPDIKADIAIDGRLATPPVQLTPGVHQVVIEGTLTGRRWALVPRWNGEEVWANITATVQRPSPGSTDLRTWARWIPLSVTALFLVTWIASVLVRVGDIAVLAWTAGTSLLVGALIATNQVVWARWAVDQVMWARCVIVALSAAVFLPVPPRLRNTFGAFVLIGVPWLTYIVVFAAPLIGQWRLYEFGNDFWMYQRYGYRIVMQGYWLEGGSPTFYFQPFYRWISGLLHAVFGDSSVGEWFWDGACLLAGGLLSFRVTRAYAGFRWGLVAAAVTLGVFVASNARDLVGRGLGEIASAGLLSMAALCAIRSRNRSTVAALAAGALAVLAFYTRLNNLLMGLGLVAFALPLRMPVRALIQPRMWWSRVSWRTATIIPAVIGLGLLFFAWRTWHYTGVFSVFHGTQRHIVAIWQPEMPLRTVAYWMAYNVMYILTANDPPRVDIYTSPLLIGAVVAGLSMLGVPRLRDLPAAAVLFFFAAIAGAFVARGWAYTGRFSVHVMPIACALAVCAAASLFQGRASHGGRGRPARMAPAVGAAARLPTSSAFLRWHRPDRSSRGDTAPSSPQSAGDSGPTRDRRDPSRTSTAYRRSL